MNAKNSFPISLLAGTTKCQTRIVLVVTAKRELKAVQNETFFFFFLKLWTLMGGSAEARFLSKWKQLVLVKGKAGQIISLVEIFFWISQKSVTQDELTPDWGFGVETTSLHPT